MEQTGDLTTPFNPISELRVHEAGPNGPTLHRVEPFNPYVLLEQAVLLEEVALVRTTVHERNSNFVPTRLMSIPLPGVLPALRGWLHPGGNLAGTHSPE